MGNGLPYQYQKSMRYHRLGYALYKPPPFTRLFSGVLGYLDEDREWHPVLDLTQYPILNITTGRPVSPQRYTPLAVPVLKTPDSRFWSPRVSSSSHETAIAINAEADALALALPVTIGGAVEYASQGDYGAILMCDNAVVNEGFDSRELSCKWLKKNSAALREDFPDLKKHGVYISTWTYSASNIHVNAWEGREHRVMLGFQVGATGIGSLGPETSWARGHTSNGWAHFVDEKRVVFFTGVKVKYGVFGPREEVTGKWRGANKDKFLVFERGENGEDGACEAEVEPFGDNYE
ncbi:hypothetical protein QBC44DRAFT_367904 [Cladorrhinum sp. PSN332]|nr:hypothetical protein QBC44DRAFT_367904 [Cladorrhinum sp. PSN332]